MIECKFTLDLTKNGIQKSIYAKAGESQARKLIITLTHSGGVYELEGLNARVYFDDQSYVDKEDVVKIVGNTVEFVIPAALVTTASVRMCELRISRDDQIIFSPMFEVVVEGTFGNDASSSALGKSVQYQELITNEKVKSDMQDEDFVVVYDTTTGKVMCLPWSKVKGMLVVTKHSDLDERDAENQHPIEAITGLQDALNSNESNISSAEQRLQVQYDSLNSYVINVEDGLWSVLTDVEAKAHNHNNWTTLNSLSRDGNVLLFDGNKVGGTDGLDGKSAYQSAVEGGYSGTEAEFYATLAVAHEHANKSTLDKFGETDGALTFDGNAVGGSSKRPTAQETFLYDDYELVPDASIIQSSLAVVSFGEIEKIPVGTEIKTIEFLYNETWVDIHEMFELDAVPYSVNIGKVFYSEQNGCYFYGNAVFPLGSVNVIAENITNGVVTATKITYYTD